MYGLCELWILMGPLIVGEDAIDEFVKESDELALRLSLNQE
jgi:hypothetical protein